MFLVLPDEVLQNRTLLGTRASDDHSRSSVNKREVSEGSMGVNDTLGLALLVLMVRCKTRKTFTSTIGRIGEYSSPATHVRVKALEATFV